MAVVVKRFDVYLVSLDPTIGSEIQKTRPCAVVSPDVSNQHISTIIIAPMTTQGASYPTRVGCNQNKNGQIVLDQIRTIDKTRLLKRLGRLAASEQKKVLVVLAEMFAE